MTSVLPKTKKNIAIVEVSSWPQVPKPKRGEIEFRLAFYQISSLAKDCLSLVQKLPRLAYTSAWSRVDSNRD